MYIVLLLCSVCVSYNNHACAHSIVEWTLTCFDCKLIIFNCCHTSITFGDKDGYIHWERWESIVLLVKNGHNISSI